MAPTGPLHAADDLRPLGLELGGVALVRLLLALKKSYHHQHAFPQRRGAEEDQRVLLRYEIGGGGGGVGRERRRLTSSRPLHLWSSNKRCLPQKWPLQKLQSPTMRWAGSLHSLAVQRMRLAGMMSGREHEKAERSGISKAGSWQIRRTGPTGCVYVWLLMLRRVD